MFNSIYHFCLLTVVVVSTGSLSDVPQITVHDLMKMNDSGDDSVLPVSGDNDVEITSPGYPEPFPANSSGQWSIEMNNATGIILVIKELDLNPLSDFIKITANFEEIVTGTVKEKSYLFINVDEVLIEFYSSENNNIHKGFHIIASLIVEDIVVPTVPPEVSTEATIHYESKRIFLVVPSIFQTLDTWNSFKESLAESVNSFVSSHNMALETCFPENITFNEIERCSQSWQDSENCIQLEFVIHLQSLDDSDEYELSVSSMSAMWNEYGRDKFSSMGVTEFMPPDTNTILIVWVGVSLGVVFVFLLILYAIWKYDFFKDYRRMTSNHDDNQTIMKNQTDIDISMFPSPHQIVPSLFPINSDGYAPGSGLPYDFENRPITFTQSDFEKLDPDVVKRSRQLQESTDNQLLSSEIVNFNELDRGNHANSYFPEDGHSPNSLGSPPTVRSNDGFFLNGANRNGESMS